MKLISMHAPWGQLLALGIKDVENRSRSTVYRGPVALHCTMGGASDSKAIEILDDLVEDGLITSAQSKLIWPRLASDRGKIIGVAKIVGCRLSDEHPSRWAIPGGFALEMAQARLVVPVECTGTRGITTLDPAIAVNLRRVS